MRSLFAVLLLTLTLWGLQSPAAFLCESIHPTFIATNSERRVITLGEYGKKWHSLFHSALLGKAEDGSVYPLQFDWNQQYPASLVWENRSDLQNPKIKLQPSRKNRSWVGDDNPELALIGIHRMFSRLSIDYDHFYKEVYHGYEGRIDSKLIQKLIASEKLLPEDRQAIGAIQDLGPMNDNPLYKMIGTLRIFHGRQNLSATNPKLPFEILMEERGIKSSTAQAVAELRKSNPNANIFEVGKFNIRREHPLRDRVRVLLELFLLKKYLDYYPKGHFYIHVATAEHVALYKRAYGVEIIETLHIPKTPEELAKKKDGEPDFHTEYILYGTGESGGNKIRSRYNLKNEFQPEYWPIGESS